MFAESSYSIVLARGEAGLQTDALPPSMFLPAWGNQAGAIPRNILQNRFQTSLKLPQGGFKCCLNNVQNLPLMNQTQPPTEGSLEPPGH